MMRETIARWLCPQLGKDAAAWHRTQVDASYMQRWLGHDYPMIEVALDYLLISVRNHFRGLDAKAIDQSYPNMGGRWPSDISAFRERLRAHFKPQPIPPRPVTKRDA